MKGTEKQVRWAEDIKANAINTCTANIERMSAQPIFDPSTINRMVSRVGELITNGKTTLEQFAAGSGINVADL